MCAQGLKGADLSNEGSIDAGSAAEMWHRRRLSFRHEKSPGRAGRGAGVMPCLVYLASVLLPSLCQV